MSDTYSVVMTGKIIEGFDVDQVKANVSQLFKLSGEQLEKMFSGKPVAVRRGISKEQAMKLRTALTKAGALAAVKAVRPAVEEKAKPASKPTSKPKLAAEEAVVSASRPTPKPTSKPATRKAAPKAKEAAMPNLCCPRCGHEQAFISACGLCKMDLTLHIQRLQRKEQAKAARRQAAG